MELIMYPRRQKAVEDRLEDGLKKAWNVETQTVGKFKENTGSQ